LSNQINELKISTPGRVCLFGEHQDYLKLPIVACAISLRISIDGIRRDDTVINIQMPDIGDKETLKLDEKIIYTKERDYFKSSINVLKKHGFTFSNGFDCKIEGKIPINAGTSSSSALIITWLNFLVRISDQAARLSPEELAQYGYEAEVLEFSEPGGMMDHYSTAIGGIIALDFDPSIKVTKLNTQLGTFVLGNSHQPKNTKYILGYVKNQILGVDRILKTKYPDFSLKNITVDELQKFRSNLNDDQFKILEGTIKNRDLTIVARKELSKENPDHKLTGKLLNEHHEVLRDILGISTTKIDRMIDAALKAGAYGAKINGSGGGGCMFAYAPENPEKVKSAIEGAGGEAFIIIPDSGSREEVIEITK
jgi:galactokinase